MRSENYRPKSFTTTLWKAKDRKNKPMQKKKKKSGKEYECIIPEAELVPYTLVNKVNILTPT